MPGASPARCDDALRLGCVGDRLHDLPRLGRRATTCTRSSASSPRRRRRNGLAVVVWSYPRGAGLSKDGETAHRRRRLRRADRRAARRARHQGEAADGAPRAGGGEEGLREARAIPIDTLAERVRHVVQSAVQRPAHRHLLGRRGQGTTQVFDEVRAIRDGGGFGSIIGRNSFQRRSSRTRSSSSAPSWTSTPAPRSDRPRGRRGRHQDRPGSVRQDPARPGPGPRRDHAEPRLRNTRGRDREVPVRRPAARHRGRLPRGGGPGRRRSLRGDQPAVGDRRAHARVRHPGPSGEAAERPRGGRPRGHGAAPGGHPLAAGRRAAPGQHGADRGRHRPRPGHHRARGRPADRHRQRGRPRRLRPAGRPRGGPAPPPPQGVRPGVASSASWPGPASSTSTSSCATRAGPRSRRRSPRGCRRKTPAP